VRNSRFAVASRYQLIGLGLLVAVLLALVALPGRSQAATEPFKIDFDQSTMQVGLLSDLPLGELASTASLEGTIDDQGNVTVPKGKFTLPEIGITDPLTVKMFMGIESDATGTFNAQTGALVLNAKAGVWVSVNLPELFDALDTLGLDVSGQLGPLAGIIGGVGDLTCGFSPMDVTFTTGETSLGSGSPFTKGPLGPGALTAEWSQLGPFSGKTKILGLIDVCQAIKQYAPSLIEGWNRSRQHRPRLAAQQPRQRQPRPELTHPDQDPGRERARGRPSRQPGAEALGLTEASQGQGRQEGFLHGQGQEQRQGSGHRSQDLCEDARGIGGRRRALPDARQGNGRRHPDPAFQDQDRQEAQEAGQGRLHGPGFKCRAIERLGPPADPPLSRRESGSRQRSRALRIGPILGWRGRQPSVSTAGQMFDDRSRLIV